MFKFLLFGIFFGFLPMWALASCPTGWEPKPSSTLCRAKLPSDDYFYINGANDAYPVCGAGRIPVLPSFEPRPISTNLMPNSNKTYVHTAVTPNVTYPYTKSDVDPTYLYDSFTRCVCHLASVTQQSPLPNKSESDVFPGGNYPGTYARVYPDTYEAIVSQDQDANARYNRAAIAADNTLNGRNGLIYGGGQSQCGCPNLNETTSSNASSVSGEIMGEHCVPKITSSSSEGRVLMTYNPTIHTGANATAVASAMGPFIMDEGDEQISGVIPSTIQLPTTNGGLQNYKRKIWLCAPPYQINSSNLCELSSNLSDHQCAAGGVEALASPVSSEVSGATMIEKFNNTVNKRLACCMNENVLGLQSSMFLKYDCLDNSTTNYSNFDALWESHEEGLPNAVVMTNALGEYINGFYTLSGAKCSQYSDFASSAPYKPKRLTKGANGQWTAADFTSSNREINPDNDLSTLMIQKGLSIPTSPSEMVRCPVLVRVATVVTCPAKVPLPALQRTFTPSGNGAATRCSSAASVKLHVRIEQLHEIQGIPNMNPVDTVQEKRLVSSISVDKIIANKSQGKCPGGATLSGETCVYR